jgi:hypothetical protein
MSCKTVPRASPPPGTQRKVSRSIVPPLRIITACCPARMWRRFQAAATGAAPAPSVRVCVGRHSRTLAGCHGFLVHQRPRITGAFAYPQRLRAGLQRGEPLLPAPLEQFAWRVGRAARCNPRPEGRRRKPLPVDFFGATPAVRSWPAVSGLRGAPLLQALDQLPQLRRAHAHDTLRHRGRPRLLAGHQPRAHVARERQQLLESGFATPWFYRRSRAFSIREIIRTLPWWGMWMMRGYFSRHYEGGSQC